MPKHERLRDEQVRANRPQRSEAEPCADCPGAPPIVSSLGNAAVQRLLRSTEAEEEQPSADDAIAGAIEADRGGGSAIDAEAAERFGGAFGADLSGVRIHDDASADSLNEAVHADAFTTGSDIFFRDGKYQPGTSDGDRLLAHELTHVVQQGGSPDASSGGLEVSDPQDASEREADAVAHDITAPGGSIDRQEEEEEEMLQFSLQRQEVDEEEEMLMTSPALDRQEEDEEEMLQFSLQRQDEEEEEEMLMTSPALDRQEEDEEEMFE